VPFLLQNRSLQSSARLQTDTDNESNSSLCSANFNEHVTRSSVFVSQDSNAVSITKTGRIIFLLEKMAEFYADSHPKYYEIGNVHMTVILKHIRVTIFVVERK